MELQVHWELPEHSVGYITSAVQLGFITGTLMFAVLTIADRYSPRWVFFWCAIAGAVVNSAILAAPRALWSLLILRFICGFFLAGIYPVGMKIATGWYQEGLGRALGYLVGALVFGTAFPHLLQALGSETPWQVIITGVSVAAALGGTLMLLFVPDGPYLPRRSMFNPWALALIFRSRYFRASAFGYFGHMWELYTLWAFIPVWLVAYAENAGIAMNVPLWSFAVISVGFIGCVGGGLISQKSGSAPVAAVQLLMSGLCCLLSPLLFHANPAWLIVFLVVWGITVVGDSPQFSALNAATAPSSNVGSALTIANSIGFLITVISLQTVNSLLPLIGPEFIFWVLIPGPIIGLWALSPLYRAHHE